MNPVQILNGEGKQENTLGTHMLICLRGHATDAFLSLVETHDLPGGGQPAHIRHREEETCQVLAGEDEFSFAGKTITAKEWTTLFTPRGFPHTYRSIGQMPGRLMPALTTAGCEGFFEPIGTLTQQRQQDMPCVTEIAKTFELEILQPSSA